MRATWERCRCVLGYLPGMQRAGLPGALQAGKWQGLPVLFGLRLAKPIETCPATAQPERWFK